MIKSFVIRKETSTIGTSLFFFIAFIYRIPDPLRIIHTYHSCRTIKRIVWTAEECERPGSGSGSGFKEFNLRNKVSIRTENYCNFMWPIAIDASEILN